MLFNRRHLSVLCLAIVAVLSLIGLRYCNAQVSTSQDLIRVTPIEPEVPVIRILVKQLYQIRTKIQLAINNPNDLDKLDFSLPGDAGYGDSPELEVFNPDGKVKAHPLNQAVLERATGIQGTKALFNLRRIEESDQTIQETLYAVIPDVTEKACQDYVRHTIFVGSDGEKRLPPILELPSSITLAPDISKVLTDSVPLPNVRTCFQGAEKRIFLFFPLGKRLKRAGSSEWQTP